MYTLHRWELMTSLIDVTWWWDSCGPERKGEHCLYSKKVTFLHESYLQGLFICFLLAHIRSVIFHISLPHRQSDVNRYIQYITLDTEQDSTKCFTTDSTSCIYKHNSGLQLIHVKEIMIPVSYLWQVLLTAIFLLMSVCTGGEKGKQ